MAQEPHWTEDSSDAFAHRLAFDFIAQIEKRMETVRISQAELARKEHTELAGILIRKLNIHEGFWCVFIEFGFTAANVPAGPDGKTFLPASISFVKKIGIQRFDEATNLTVDAAQVNPIAKKKR